MKSKNYRNGKFHFHSTFKQVGEGWEVSFWQGKNSIFVGNFIHAKEATQWWSIMNREITQFSRKYAVGQKFPMSWYMHFAKNHLYNCYYGYLDRIFARYHRDYASALKKDVRKYQQLKKNWVSKASFFKAA
jgi:hypothetical protein